MAERLSQSALKASAARGRVAGQVAIGHVSARSLEQERPTAHRRPAGVASSDRGRRVEAVLIANRSSYNLQVHPFSVSCILQCIIYGSIGPKLNLFFKF